MYNTLIYEKKDNIGVLTVNRPDKLNALSNELTEELQHLLDEIEKDVDLRVVVITGAGDKAFVAGADINELVERDALKGRDVSRFRQALFARIENLPVPVIAAVNGYALGGGLELALACNIRIASEKAQFDAQEAHRIGLVNRVVSPDELMESVMTLAKKIASRPPLAVKYAKEAMNRSQEGDTASGYALESYLHALACTTEDKTEGVAAFLEKRKGQFKGK
jgi:enoyl-CoA hydratase